MLGRCAYNHLCTLSRRDKSRSVTELPAILRILKYALSYISHRFIHALEVLFGSEVLERPLIGYFDVYAHSVGIQSRLIDKFARCSGNALQVNVTVEAMHGAQLLSHPCKPLHRIVGIAHDTRAEKQTFDIVSAIKLHRHLNDLAHRHCSPLYVVAATIYAVGAVIHTVVRKHNLKQGYATPIVGKTMTNANSADCVSYAVALYSATNSAA